MNQVNINQTGAAEKPRVNSKNGTNPHFSIGLLVRNFFSQYGLYKVKISQIKLHSPYGKICRIQYENREQKDWSTLDAESVGIYCQLIPN